MVKNMYYRPSLKFLICFREIQVNLKQDKCQGGSHDGDESNWLIFSIMAVLISIMTV